MKQEVDIDIKFGTDQTIKYRLLAIYLFRKQYREEQLIEKYLHGNLMILVIQTKVNNFIFVFQLQKYILVHTYFFLIDILKFSKEMYI